MAGLDFSAGSMNWDQLEKNLGADVKGSEKKNFKDDRFWSLSRDENDSGAAIIRLLPDPTGTPYIQRYAHAFQSFDALNKKKRWFINVSPQTINLPCPASELWSGLFNMGTEEGKAEAGNFKRSIKYIANIKVIKDPANPQNDGKIFLWEFGPKLKDKFMQALNPNDNDRQLGEEPKELFNPLTGCNIKLKIKKAAGFLNYDETSIENISSIYADADTAKNDIISNGHKLQEFLEPSAFLTHDELKSKLKYVLDCYQPKSMDSLTFKSIANQVVGSETPPPAKEVHTPVESQSAVQTPQAEPYVAQTPVATPTPIESDPSLDFLDDL